MDTAITKEMYKEMGIDGKVYSFGQEIAESLKQRFEEIDRVAEYNQLKVVHAMQQCRASEACLYASSGYGYNDVGRDTLEGRRLGAVPVSAKRSWLQVSPAVE